MLDINLVTKGVTVMFEKDSLVYTLSQVARQLAMKIEEIHSSVTHIEEFLQSFTHIPDELSKLKDKQRALTKELSAVKEHIGNHTVCTEGTIFRFESPFTVHYGDRTFSVHEFTDPLVLDVMDLFVKENQASVSMVQRRFRVGYSRAARIVDYLQAQGMISESLGSNPRKVLISEKDWSALKMGILYKTRTDSLNNKTDTEADSAPSDEACVIPQKPVTDY